MSRHQHANTPQMAGPVPAIFVWRRRAIYAPSAASPFRSDFLYAWLKAFEESGSMLRVSSLILPTTLIMVSPAFAHTGIDDASGVAHGFMHPVGGMDHVLAMVAVGLFAALLGGRALWLVPASFVGAMVVGGALGMAGVGIPFVEIGIGLSVVVLGAAVALRLHLSIAAAMALAGFFAIFHGYAHGAEMPDAASGFAYGLGFMLATAMLHGVGICLGLTTERIGQLRGPNIGRAAGGIIASAGVALLAQMI